MKILKKEFILNSNQRDFLCDVQWVENSIKKPIILFIHGFKGFKDWGHFNLIADFFAKNQFVFIKFNLSHNGTNPSNPIDFVDLEAFSNNTFTKELDDLKVVLDTIELYQLPISTSEYNTKSINLIGHSRGGGLALLKAGEDTRIKKVITLAAIHDLEKRWNQSFLDEWKDEGIKYVFNSRTNQNMPLKYQLVEDFKIHKKRLDIPTIVEKLNLPILVFHGTNDDTLPVSIAYELAQWNKNIELQIIENANHVFGGKHPYTYNKLPKDTLFVIQQSLEFLLK